MLFYILVTITLVLLNGFFVAAEFAIVKVRVSQLELKAQAGTSGSTNLAIKIVNNLDGYLAATQLGITLASLALGWVGEPVVSKIIISLMNWVGVGMSEATSHQIALPIAFAIISILHIVFGELAPKTIAIQKAEQTTLLLAYPLNFFYIIFRPFIWVLNGFANFILKLIGIKSMHDAEIHSSDELKYLIQQSNEGGNIESNNYDIIKNAFDFSERTAKQIMIPRNLIATLNVNTFNEQELEQLLDEGYSRIPCYEGSIDNTIGLIHIKDILKKLRKHEEIVIRDLIRPIIIIPENKKIGSLLKEFQVRHIHMAIIVNEFGGVEGIVTMEDIIEELVGEIQDEYDNEIPIVEKVDEFTFKVFATAPINDINNLLPIQFEEDKRFDTLAGIIIQEFGRIPSVGEKITIEEYEATVLERAGNKLITVQLKMIVDTDHFED
ncbi:MAG: hemolysin family protein [Crocinitomicaceae bacterium]|nr:hemolysin family protein [Crocinitomicaceae bacterium]